ncbi:hypothetical protein F4823DRAFT_636468 [Ustulina deusta]|nr:hypothetical protein F4823DRAFT_636468 [Ustulina deusta]
MDGPREGLRIVIIGGSLAGLMCGVALKHAGHSVNIIERSGNDRESHMAGVCLGYDAEIYLSQHDRFLHSFAHRSNCMQTLTDGQPPRIFVNILRIITNWDTLYYRLRSCFDGYASKGYPSPPLPTKTDGPVVYDFHNQVVDVTRTSEDEMTVSVLNHDTSEISNIKADLVIGADGPDSFVRSKYLPSVKRKYVGYIAWRGTVPESEVSMSTRAIFARSVSLQLLDLQHCIIYTIPGPSGSLEPGERMFNFLWYTNESEEALDQIMMDEFGGHRHHNIVPAGHVRKDIWKQRVDTGKRIPLAAPFLEILIKIKRPFIQVITEFCSPHAAFEEGRVLLIGDALSLYRPHTAFSGTQAAFDALKIEEYVDQKISWQEWEENVLRFARLHCSQSKWWGSYYQHRLPYTLLCLIQYWFYCVVDQAKSWWGQKRPFLRTSINRVVPYDS